MKTVEISYPVLQTKKLRRKLTTCLKSLKILFRKLKCCSRLVNVRLDYMYWQEFTGIYFSEPQLSNISLHVKKVKRIKNYVLKCNLNLYFLIWQELEIEGCAAWFTYFLDFLNASYNYAKFDHCMIYLTDFRDDGLANPICEQHQKGLSWIGLLRRSHLQFFCQY